MKRRLACIFLAAVLMAVLAACGGSEPVGHQPGQPLGDYVSKENSELQEEIRQHSEKNTREGQAFREFEKEPGSGFLQDMEAALDSLE